MRKIFEPKNGKEIFDLWGGGLGFPSPGQSGPPMQAVGAVGGVDCGEVFPSHQCIVAQNVLEPLHPARTPTIGTFWAFFFEQNQPKKKRTSNCPFLPWCVMPNTFLSIGGRDPPMVRYKEGARGRGGGSVFPHDPPGKDCANPKAEAYIGNYHHFHPELLKLTLIMWMSNLMFPRSNGCGSQTAQPYDVFQASLLGPSLETLFPSTLVCVFDELSLSGCFLLPPSCQWG